MTDTTTSPQNTNSKGETHLGGDKDQVLQEPTSTLSRTLKRCGPNTAAGKNAVSKNAITHGITSLSPVAGGEDAAEWAEFKKSWHDCFKPVGLPEEELVDHLAITAWRRRRVIRREVALIDSRYEAIDEGVQSIAHSYIKTIAEQGLESAGCDVSAGVELLEILDVLDADTQLDPEGANSALGVLHFSGPLSLKELPEDQEVPFTGTAGSFRDWISAHAAAEETDYPAVLQGTLQIAERILSRQAQRREAMAKNRLARERAAVMPSVQEMDSLVRHEAHLDRSFSRALSQLELLQRMRSGERLPAPDRVEVTVH